MATEKDVKTEAEETKEEKTEEKAEETKEEKTEETAEETKEEKKEEKKESFEDTVRAFTEKAVEVMKPAAAKAAATVKKTAEKAKKTASKARVKAASLMEEANTKVYIQYAGNEALAKDVVERAKEAYIAEGFKATGIKTVQVYLKPEENAAYYVINNTAGKIDLF